MVAELLAPPPLRPASVLTCDATELRLATSALYVAELALGPPVDADAVGPEPEPFTVVCASGQHPGRTADIADLVIPAGLGIVRLLVPALDIDGGGGHADPEEQELVVTTGRHVHLVWILPGTEPRVVYVVLDRNRGTVVAVRHFLRRHLASDPVREPPVERRPTPARTGVPVSAIAPVIALDRRPARRGATGVPAAGRPPRRGADPRPATGPGAPTTAAPRPPSGVWSCDDHTLRRVLTGLRSMP